MDELEDKDYQESKSELYFTKDTDVFYTTDEEIAAMDKRE